MPDLIEREHLQKAGRIKTLMATYRESQDLINIGAYSPGSNADIDEAIEKMPAIREFLQQLVEEKYDINTTIKWMSRIV